MGMITTSYLYTKADNHILRNGLSKYISTNQINKALDILPDNVKKTIEGMKIYIDTHYNEDKRTRAEYSFSDKYKFIHMKQPIYNIVSKYEQLEVKRLMCIYGIYSTINSIYSSIIRDNEDLSFISDFKPDQFMNDNKDKINNILSIDNNILWFMETRY